MDQYFNQMEKIVKERKTSSRIRFMLQDIIDLRLVSMWLLMHVIFVLSAQEYSWVQSPAPCSGCLWFTMYFPTEVCFIDLSDLLEHDIGYSGRILLNGCLLLLLLLNLNTFLERLMGEKLCRKIYCRTEANLDLRHILYTITCMYLMTEEPIAS